MGNLFATSVSVTTGTTQFPAQKLTEAKLQMDPAATADVNIGTSGSLTYTISTGADPVTIDPGTFNLSEIHASSSSGTQTVQVFGVT